MHLPASPLMHGAGSFTSFHALLLGPAEVRAGWGRVGRLAVGGPIPVGYCKHKLKSDAPCGVIGGARWSGPGACARVGADGTIARLGRGWGVINSGGGKIYPEEVEEA